MSARRLFRSAGFRFGAIYALLLTASAIALASFLWWATAGLLDRQTDEAINADAQGLAERWAEGGLSALVITISDRVAVNVDDDAIYLLADDAMNVWAGNLKAWPPPVISSLIPYELPIDRAGVRSLATVRRIELPGGFHLLVGRDVQVRSQMRALLTDALLWAVVVVLLMATIGALVIRNLFRRTLANISATATSIAAGNFAQRVTLSGRGDEFDQLAEVINDMLDRIGRLMDGVRQVSNAIAHDLRTPITRARTRLEDAALHAVTADDLRAAIERATHELDDIVGVFQALLRIAEIEAGSRRSLFTRLDLAPLLTEIADLYTPVAEEQSIELRLSVPQTLPVYGDRAMIQQAIANLVDNALKFSPAGGVVELAASVSDRTNIVVADQGPGIPALERSKATERFYRGESARHTPGSGLGLSLVQAVAVLHDGVLHLKDNEPGLRAELVLPNPDDAEAVRGGERTSRVSALQRWIGNNNLGNDNNVTCSTGHMN